MYVPRVIIDDLETIMEEEDIVIKSEGFRKISKYAKIGRIAIKNPTLIDDLNKVSPRIPIGQKIKQKKVKHKNFTDVLGL